MQYQTKSGLVEWLNGWRKAVIDGGVSGREKLAALGGIKRMSPNGGHDRASNRK
jgi:hypothetical protein